MTTYTTQQRLASNVCKALRKRVGWQVVQGCIYEIYVPDHKVVFSVWPDNKVSWRAARDIQCNPYVVSSEARKLVDRMMNRFN